MSEFQGMDDLLADFLTESNDLLSALENKLVTLEQCPNDLDLLNDIFRGFHTIKGGAGFLNAAHLVSLCHLTENLFDKLRHGKLAITPETMDVILASTAAVREMFDVMGQSHQPGAADAALIERLKLALEGKLEARHAPAVVAAAPAPIAAPAHRADDGPPWAAYYEAFRSSVAGAAPRPILMAQTATGGEVPPAPAEAALEAPRAAAKDKEPARKAKAPASGNDSSIRVDTARLDQVLNLSGEIGLAKNRVAALRTALLAGDVSAENLQLLDTAVNDLSLLVSDLQNAVMKTRMQPIGRLFQKYPRIARDLARSLGKDVELVLVGEETEIDKTMIEDLADPLIHLIRNAVDHGVEMPEARLEAGKPAKSSVQLEARQEGDHIVIQITDDGKGMDPYFLRNKAVEKGLITAEAASELDDRQCFNLVFLPGFSTAATVSDVSGRGVGMDVVRTNIQRLNGTIEIRSAKGQGSSFIISLPLTLAILPVLLVKLGDQPFAVPLALVREIMTIEQDCLQDIGGRQALTVRGDTLPVVSLATLLGWEAPQPQQGVVVHTAESTFVLAVDSFAGRDDAVIKSLDDFRPKGVAGVTATVDGQVVLILDLPELLTGFSAS